MPAQLEKALAAGENITLRGSREEGRQTGKQRDSFQSRSSVGALSCIEKVDLTNHYLALALCFHGLT